MRDLLGDTTGIALDVLPVDHGDGGFDNNAQALVISPSNVDRYEEVAITLAEAVRPGSEGWSHVVTCDPAAIGEDACAQQVAGEFAAKAWRRPIEAGEADRLLALYAEARAQEFGFAEGIQTLVEAALLSPHFLFRPELDATPDSPTVHAVQAHELATRLSYFLWSSMPDAELSSAAESGDLASADGLRAEVQRMLADPKAEALFTRFPMQWLGVEDVGANKRPDTTIFPEFTDSLEASMERETALYMHDFMTGTSSFLDFVDAKYTYLNAELAELYGIPGQFGADLVRVDLSTDERGGILTQGSVLTVTSASERTSPTFRGNWVLSRLLGTPTPPPPANVDVTLVNESSSVGLTTRERLEVHREDPQCATCHDFIDPIGFGMDAYDAIGRHRTSENGAPIDASGTLVSGETFDGVQQLAAVLKANPDVSTSVVKHLFSYATGREPVAADACTLEALTASFEQSDQRMQSLILSLAGTDAIRMRVGVAAVN